MLSLRWALKCLGLLVSHSTLTAGALVGCRALTILSSAPIPDRIAAHPNRHARGGTLDLLSANLLAALTNKDGAAQKKKGSKTAVAGTIGTEWLSFYRKSFEAKSSR